MIVVICPPPCVSNICLFFQHALCFPNIVVRMFFSQYVTVPPYLFLILPICFHMLSLMFPHVNGSHIFLDFFPSYCDVDFLAPKWAQGQRGRALQRLPSQVYSGSAGSNWNCGLEGLKRLELLKDGASSIFCWLAGDFPFKQLKDVLWCNYLSSWLGIKQWSMAVWRYSLVLHGYIIMIHHGHFHVMTNLMNGDWCRCPLVIKHEWLENPAFCAIILSKL